jgi:hypothetical protein
LSTYFSLYLSLGDHPDWNILTHPSAFLYSSRLSENSSFSSSHLLGYLFPLLSQYWSFHGQLQNSPCTSLIWFLNNNTRQSIYSISMYLVNTMLYL